MAVEYGLTPNGFVIKPFSVILEEQKQLYREKFGSDIDLSPESVAGAVCYNEAIKIAQIWEMLGALYTCHDVNSATGVHLDRLGNQVNVQRQVATATEVQCVLWGDNGTVVPQGHLVEDDNENYFKLKEEMTLNKDFFCGISLHLKQTNTGTVYTFMINNTEITYTVADDDTVQNIISNIQGAIISIFDSAFVFLDDVENENVKFYDANLKNQWGVTILTNDSIEIEEVGESVKYIAVDKGSVYVGVGTLTTIVNEISGLNSVYNYVEGSTGTDTETDDWFRLSIKSKQRQSIATETAIENNIYNTVPNVSYCRCFSNRTMQYVGNFPPKSIQVIVQGGDDEEIARAIFNSQPAGIEAYGTTVIDVTDSEGTVWKIGFSRPVTKYLWIQVQYTYYDEEEHPVDTEGSIKDAIVDWARNNFRIGDDVIYQRFYQPIYQVSGISSAEIKIAMTNDLNPPQSQSDYKSENIVVAQNEIVSVDATRITATLVEEE